MDEKKHENQPYPALERLSLGELQNLLRQDYYASDEMDMDYIMAILEVIERREAENPKAKPFDTEAGWESFKENYIDKQSDYSAVVPHGDTPKTSPGIPKTRRYSSRKVRRMVVALAAVLLLGGMLTAQALGYNVFQAIARWTGEIFSFGDSYVDDTSPLISQEFPADKEYSSLQEALDDIGVTQPVAPAWYPDGFTQTQLIVTPMAEYINLNAFYENGAQSFSISIVVHGVPQEGHLRNYEKDGHVVSEYEVGGITHYIMTNNGKMVSIWMNNNMECSIAGDIAEMDMQKMIDSIYGG